MNESTIEEKLVGCIGKELATCKCKRITPTTTIDSAAVIAGWKRKTLNMNRGVVIVRAEERLEDMKKFATTIKKQIGWKIGYIPFLYELGLQVVVIGRDILKKATDIETYVDTINTMTVLLQSIHILDLGPYTISGDGQEEESIRLVDQPMMPRWAQALEFIQSRGGLTSFQFEPMGREVRYSRKTGMASVSARTWAMTVTKPIIDAVERGVKEVMDMDIES